MWSYNELTNYLNATGFIQYKNENGVYQNLVDLYTDFAISKNRNHQDYLSLTLPVSTNSIRFYTTSEAIGDNNKGRISLGNILVVYEN